MFHFSLQPLGPARGPGLWVKQSIGQGGRDSQAQPASEYDQHISW